MITTSLHTPHLAFASATQFAASAWRRLWAALEAHGRRRAATELRHLAMSYHTCDPALAQRLYRAAMDIDTQA